jgi:hypothetical protein
MGTDVPPNERVLPKQDYKEQTDGNHHGKDNNVPASLRVDLFQQAIDEGNPFRDRQNLVGDAPERLPLGLEPLSAQISLSQDVVKTAMRVLK